MARRRELCLVFAAIGILGCVVAAPGPVSAQNAVAIDADNIGGVVTGPSGPEAGVWVIAETTDLPTRFARMVVTDDQGRYVVPDLPKATYRVWVRGYGLVDSPKMTERARQDARSPAVPAPSETEAAQYYPAIYWYSMLKIPEASQFGGTSDIPDKITQIDWLKQVKNIGCIGCHQLGQLSTRTIPKQLGEFSSSEEAWIRRVSIGPVRRDHGEPAGRALRRRAIQVLRRLDGPHCPGRAAACQAEAAGRCRAQHRGDDVGVAQREEVPARPDLLGPAPPTSMPMARCSARRNTRTDVIPILDPKTHTVSEFVAPVRDPDTPEALGPGHAASDKVLAPSPYWGEEKIWDSRANNHNGMFDRQGRVWFAATVRGPNNPDFCKQGSDHPSAKLFPLERTNRA